MLCRLPKNGWLSPIFSYKSISDGKWNIIALGSAGDPTTGWYVVKYDFDNGDWIVLHTGTPHPMSDAYDNAILLPEKEKIYALSRWSNAMMQINAVHIFDINNKRWTSKNWTLLKTIAQMWNVMYIPDFNQVHAINCFNGRFHIALSWDYDTDNNQPSPDDFVKSIIDGENETDRPQLIYCQLLQQLTVLGGVLRPQYTKDDLKWIYQCDFTQRNDLGHYVWNKLDITMPNHVTPGIKAVLGLKHIIFVFYKRVNDKCIGVCCLDLLTNKWFLSDKYFEDIWRDMYGFSVVAVGDEIIHLFEIEKRNHIRLSLWSLLPKELFEFYSYIVQGYANYKHSTPTEIVQLICDYLGCFFKLQ